MIQAYREGSLEGFLQITQMYLRGLSILHPSVKVIHSKIHNLKDL